MGDTTDDEVRALAASLRRLFQLTTAVVDEDGRTAPLITKVSDHLGLDLGDVLSVATKFPAWEHVNVQRGVDAYLAEHTPGAAWFGVSGSHRGHEDLLSMLVAARRQQLYDLGAADYATAAVGPDRTAEVVQLGLVATRAPDGAPVVVGVRGAAAEYGQPTCRLEVLAADRGTARAVGEEIERLMRLHDVFRRQVLSFGVSEHRGNELVSFLPRPTLDADAVVLPDGVLDSVERHVVGVAEHSERLLAAGQHLKRGLLLHGPPGTGKTHTVRYLMSRMTGCTVILLTGPAMRLIGQAAALARRLQPAMLVVEDVDLVAMDRGHSPGGTNPLLFALLEAMDGVGADADVTFVLTTNRAAELERALADRPGRIDLAVEIPRPDAEGRRRLLRLYGRGVDLRADLEPVVAATEGATASFIKELLRRAVLDAVRAGGAGTPVIGDELAALAREMTDERRSLTSVLLGGKPGPPGRPRLGPHAVPGVAPDIV
ncbi:ATP-binding protein [Saccharothrix australiensis]|uniref:ATPase family protein associated with various cellular activities (AAA) n=1 Tax=Saccharothrix australiensis TaxID=2072 RepID=A0A495W1P9_9PSEU|nr:ATP-binding protein [Saccharothrix australiensis]RKT54947.1 ATPase family protein associated with various cellular activities (AAA) [Saccharothrix australiensis]